MLASALPTGGLQAPCRLRQFARRGAELHVVGRGRIEADTAAGFIVTAVEGLAAEHYRRVISEKTRDALARLRARGRRVSRFPPYGYQLARAAACSGTRRPVPPARVVVTELLAAAVRKGLLRARDHGAAPDVTRRAGEAGRAA